jgi:hypothetical protein
MKTIAPPIAELLAQLHDHAAGLAKLIEAIPALNGDDLPQIINRVHLLGTLKELEAEFPAGKVPSDEYLRTRTRLLREHQMAANHNWLSYELRCMSNKQLAARIELLGEIVAKQFDSWTDREIDDVIAELQGERRRRKREAKSAEAQAAEPSVQEEDFETDVDDLTALPPARGNGALHVVG